MDYGSEFTSHLFKEWCEKWDIEMAFTQPGNPTQNAFIEGFNGTYRREVLDCCCFSTLNDVSQKTERWIREYNKERPHQVTRRPFTNTGVYNRKDLAGFLYIRCRKNGGWTVRH
jgi:transposase InsO family protein